MNCKNCGYGLKQSCGDFEKIICTYEDGECVKITELEKQIERMKRHANCKHCDSEGYCEVKRTYLIDLSYDGCDKWELED